MRRSRGWWWRRRSGAGCRSRTLARGKNPNFTEGEAKRRAGEAVGVRWPRWRSEGVGGSGKDQRGRREKWSGCPRFLSAGTVGSLSPPPSSPFPSFLLTLSALRNKNLFYYPSTHRSLTFPLNPAPRFGCAFHRVRDDGEFDDGSRLTIAQQKRKRRMHVLSQDRFSVNGSLSGLRVFFPLSAIASRWKRGAKIR